MVDMVKLLYKIYTLDIKYDDFISSIKLLNNDSTNFEKKCSINNEDICWLDYKYIEETIYSEYLEKRGIDINDLMASMSENIRKADPNINKESISKIISATFERKIRKEHELNIFYANDKAYFITHSKIAISKFSEITNIVLSRMEVDNFLDLLLWITKKKYYNELINNFKVVDITNLNTMEDRGITIDDHSSNGNDLMESDSVLYRLTRSQQITILEIYISSLNTNLAFKFSLYSDYPESDKTFGIHIYLKGLRFADNISNYIKSINDKKIRTEFKRAYLIFIVASLFIDESIKLYKKEHNKWDTDKKIYLDNIKQKVKQVLK